MYLCPTCKRKRRVQTTLIYVKKKHYWLSKCLECRTSIKMEEKEDTP